MKKQTFYPSTSTSHALDEAADLACLFGIGLFLAPFTKAAYEDDYNKAAQLDADSESNADNLADEWRRNRHDGESRLEVTVESDDGAKVTYQYTVEDDD